MSRSHCDSSVSNNLRLEESGNTTRYDRYNQDHIRTGEEEEGEESGSIECGDEVTTTTTTTSSDLSVAIVVTTKRSDEPRIFPRVTDNRVKAVISRLFKYLPRILDLPRVDNQEEERQAQRMFGDWVKPKDLSHDDNITTTIPTFESTLPFNYWMAKIHQSADLLEILSVLVECGGNPDVEDPSLPPIIEDYIARFKNASTPEEEEEEGDHPSAVAESNYSSSSISSIDDGGCKNDAYVDHADDIHLRVFSLLAPLILLS